MEEGCRRILLEEEDGKGGREEERGEQEGWREGGREGGRRRRRDKFHVYDINRGIGILYKSRVWYAI